MKRTFFPALTIVLLTGTGYFVLPAAAHEPAMAGMKMQTQQPNKVTVTPATSLLPNKLQNFTIKVRSTQGKPITQFARVHEKLMHFIIVSNDLQSFQHLHPNYQDQGIFNLKATLPAQGAYTAFADYTPKGQNKQVSAVALNAGIAQGIAPTADTAFSKVIDGINITLALDPKTIRPGIETPMAFIFQDIQSKPITDLQPYLGAMGHLVIVKYSPKLTAASYLHAHPQSGMQNMAHQSMPGMQMEQMKVDPVGTVTFETAFPTPGLYKMWGQFQRAGKIITADFTINIL